MPARALLAPDLHDQLQRGGGGAPLSNATRRRMESAFGRGFSDVRIHTGEHAAGMSRQLGARAFTHGNNIYFNRGHYRPDTDRGRRLLAHELTHTIQQRADGTSSASVQMDPDYRFYRHSERCAFILYLGHEGTLRRGQIQTYRVAIHHLPFPQSELRFHWRVFEASSHRLVYAPRETGPMVRIRASRVGRYLVGVAITRHGRVLTQFRDGMVLQVNQRVAEAPAQQSAQRQGRGARGQHTMPSCNGPVTEVDRARSVTFSQIDPPAINCSFTPLFHVHGRDVRISARVNNPPRAGGDWSITTFECPVRFSDAQACERVFGTARLVGGPVSQTLEYHYDPIAWNTRNIFIRIRNGSTEALRNVQVTLTPNIRDPMLQMVHDALAIAGMLPVVGIVADGLDVLIYVGEGDWGNAAVSAAAMVPAFGEGATVTRLGSRDVIRVSRRELSHVDSQALARRIERQRDLVRRGATRERGRPPRSGGGTRPRQAPSPPGRLVDLDPGLPRAPARGGRIASIARDGRAIVCWNPCATVRLEYDDVLHMSPELRQRLIRTERSIRAARRSGNETRLQQSARRVALLIDDLEEVRTRMNQAWQAVPAGVALGSRRAELYVEELVRHRLIPGLTDVDDVVGGQLGASTRGADLFAIRNGAPVGLEIKWSDTGRSQRLRQVGSTEGLPVSVQASPNYFTGRWLQWLRHNQATVDQWITQGLLDSRWADRAWVLRHGSGQFRSSRRFVVVVSQTGDVGLTYGHAHLAGSPRVIRVREPAGFR